MKRWVTISKIILINLIPLLGYLFFDWTLFEMAVVFLLETCAIYIVHEVDRYFINKETRFPFIFALIQFAFGLPVLASFTFVYSLICYTFTGDHGTSNKFYDDFINALSEIDYFWIMPILLIIEGLSVINKKLNNPNHQNISYKRMLRRMFYTHFYVIGSLFFVVLIPFGIVTKFLFVICFKVAMDYFVEDSRAWAKFLLWIKSFRS